MTNTDLDDLEPLADTGDDGPEDDSDVAKPDVSKREFTAEQRRRLAREGKALPSGAYPIETEEDLHNAAVLARSGHGDVSAARALIARRARELGVSNPLDDDSKKYRDYLISDHASPSPGQAGPNRAPLPETAHHPFTESPGHGQPDWDNGSYDVHLNMQVINPAPLTVLHTAQQDSRLNPLASSIAANPGSATLQRLDYAAAAGAGTLPIPAANPGTRPDCHTAPTGQGAAFRRSPRGRPGMPALPSPTETALKSFTTKAPGE